MDRRAGQGRVFRRATGRCGSSRLTLAPAVAEATLPHRFDVLGVQISAVNLDGAVAAIADWIADRTRTYVCITGVHGVIESHRDPDLREIHNRAGMVTPDGMPMVWLGKAEGQRHMTRVYGPDLMLRALDEGRRLGHKHYLYGGAEGVPELLDLKLCERFEGLQIVGTHSPPFRPLTPEEDSAIISEINESGADVVWVGLSTPKQERWMAAHVGKVEAPVMIGVGAAFDFHAGLKSQAPGWMQKSGLEWLFRMITEPRRLGPRYLVNNPLFLWLLLLQKLRLRRP